MRAVKDYRGWMAEEVAKTYLLETGLLDLSVTSDRKFDFVALLKTDYNKVVAIEIKASKYSKHELLRAYGKLRQQLSREKIPVIVFYINYIDRTGFIELINQTLSDELLPLNTENLKRLIRNIDYA